MKITPDDYFSEDRQGITYREDVAPMASVIFGFFGLLFLAVAIAFCVEIASWPWHGGKVAGLFTVLVFACFGVAVGLIAAGALLPQRLHFDANAKRVHGHTRGRFWPRQRIDMAFSCLSQPVIKSHEREMDTDIYDIQTTCAGYLERFPV